MNLHRRLERLEREVLPRRLAHLARVEALYTFLIDASQIEAKDPSMRTPQEWKTLRTAEEVLRILSPERAFDLLRMDTEQGGSDE